MGLRYFKFKGKEYGQAPMNARTTPFNPDDCVNINTENVQDAIEDLDGALNTTNNNLMNVESGASNIVFTTTPTEVGVNSLLKNGKVVTFSFDNKYTIADTTRRTLFTLPSGYRPKEKLNFPIATYKGLVGWAMLETNGNVNVQLYTSITSYDVFGSVTFFTP